MKNLEFQIGQEVKVDKRDYEVHSYNDGYFGICRKGNHGGSPVLGGDPAHEDDYNEDLINARFEEWDGTLIYCRNDKYGEEGYTVEG